MFFNGFCFQDELKAVAAISAKREKLELPSDIRQSKSGSGTKKEPFMLKEEEESDSEVLKDVLALPGDLLDTDLVNTIMNEDDEELTKNTDTLESFTGRLFQLAFCLIHFFFPTSVFYCFRLKLTRRSSNTNIGQLE